jgi:hypothetical protein
MTRTFAIVPLAAGFLALVYGGFNYSRQAHEANVGPLEITVGLAILGGRLLVRGKKQ